MPAASPIPRRRTWTTANDALPAAAGAPGALEDRRAGDLRFRVFAVQNLRPLIPAGERVARVGETLWIHFPAGAGRSKLTPAVLDRVAGSPMTTRNWRTVLRLAELADVEPTSHQRP